MAEKLNVDTIKRISELTTVKKISDLQTIPIIENVNGTYVTTQQYENSYLLSSTYFPDNTSYGRYINYKVKISDVTYYLSTLGSDDLNSFKATFNNFINNLCENTADSYVQLVQDKNSTDKEYSYTFKYQLSQVIPNEVIAFSYSYNEDTGEQLSTYAYTNALKPGLVNHETLEQYVRSAISRILGVPSSPAELSYAIDSVIEFVDWFKGYVRDDTSYGSLQNLINTIESKDDKVLYSTYSYVIQNKELSYAYIESSYNLLYSTIQDIDVDVPIKGVSTINKITIGNVTYILDLDDNKNLQLSVDIDNFVPFSVSVSGGSTTDNEFYTYVNGKNDITLTATANKDCTWNNWTTSNASVGESTQSNNGKTLTATGSYPDVGYCSSNVTFSWKVSASHAPTQDEQNHGHTGTEYSGEKSVSVKYTFNKYKVGVFASPQGINDISFTEISYQPQTITIYGGSWQTVSTLPSSFGSFNINSSNGNCYIYFLLPSDWVVPGKGFKWTGGEGMAETPGQANIRTLKLYNETKNYTLFRSENKYPSGTNINFKYV